MDISLLADTITQMLAPALPALVQGGQDLIADAAKALGSGAWEKVQALWGKLRSRVEQKPSAAEAVQDVARAPEDPRCSGGLPSSDQEDPRGG